MSEMIERVAAAIDKIVDLSTCGDYDIAGEIASRCAIAAIEALLEPTEAMNEAGYSAACEHDYGDLVPSREIAPATFRAMIEAALAEKKP